MSLFLFKNKGVYHHHIPKTSGATIIQGLLKAGAERVFGGKDPETKVSRGHLHIASVAEKFPDYNKYPQFTILRDPWHRICSEYVWKKSDPHFTEFNKWIYNRLSKYKRAGHLDDNHFRPQTEFVSPDVKIFLTENSQDAQDWLCEYFEEDINFESLNQSKKYIYPDINSILDQRSRGIFYEVYQQDIDLYRSEKQKYKEGK